MRQIPFPRVGSLASANAKLKVKIAEEPISKKQSSKTRASASDLGFPALPLPRNAVLGPVQRVLSPSEAALPHRRLSCHTPRRPEWLLARPATRIHAASSAEPKTEVISSFGVHIFEKKNIRRISRNLGRNCEHKFMKLIIFFPYEHI